MNTPQTTLASFRNAPGAVRVICFVMAGLPFITGWYLPSPGYTLTEHGWLPALLQTSIYFVLPYLTLFLILRRHVAAIPLYMLVGFSIVAYLVIASPLTGAVTPVFNLALMLIFASGALMLASKDQLIPLLSRTKRMWRRNHRLPVFRLVECQKLGSPNRVSGCIRNISREGLCLSGLSTQLHDWRLIAGETLSFTLYVRDRVFELRGSVVWVKEDGDNTLFGIHSDHPDAMAAIFAELPETSGPTAISKLIDGMWDNPEIRHALTTVWACAVLTAAFMPACGDQNAEEEAGKDQPEIGATVGTGGGGPSETNKVRLPFSFAIVGDDIDLTITDYHISVSGCDSGFEDSFTAENERSSIDMIEGDEGCEIFVHYLAASGTTFTPDPGQAVQGPYRPYINPKDQSLFLRVNLASDLALQAEGTRVIFEIHRRLPVSGKEVPEPIGILVSASSGKVVEKFDTDLVVFIKADRAAPADTRINLGFEGSATSGDDIATAPDSILLKQGETEAVLRLTIFDDKILEPIETIAIGVISGTNYMSLNEGKTVVELYDNEYPESIPEPVHIQAESWLSYAGNQDVQLAVSVSDDGTVIDMLGNGWKAIPFPYEITENTVLAFDFSSSSQGEVHAIGLDADLSLSEDRLFTVYGTQPWGVRDYFTYNESAPDLRHYTIPVGQYYTGSAEYLVLASDHDVSQPTATSRFENIKVYEQDQITPLPAHLNPPVARDDFFHVKPGSAGNPFDILANDDADVGETIYLAELGSLDQGGTVTQLADGRLLYTPAADFSGIETFEYTISDGFNHNQATGKVRITVSQRDPINFANKSFSSYEPGQDINATLAISQDGSSLEITGNGWKKLDINYVITAKTVLEFDFYSDNRGEVQGIGFDSDDRLSPERLFKLYGSQSWGLQAFHNYESQAPQMIRYKIPVGEYFTGTSRYLTFANDADGGDASAHSYYGNVMLYEAE